jgi:succinate dehydrogenase/fumarate reductase flavoprotein subunit
VGIHNHLHCGDGFDSGHVRSQGSGTLEKERIIMIFHEILIVGGGLAGMRAAIEAAKKVKDVAIVSRVHPMRSHSGEAQGGINAALANVEAGKDDNIDKHAFDQKRFG